MRGPGGNLRSYRDLLRSPALPQAVEKRAILRALRHAGGSQRQAARLLQISRTTLARKIEKLGIPT